jgi:uncharacterized low-complexity protein
MKPLGAAFATTLSGTAVGNAADNPFAMAQLPGGYMVARAAEGKCEGEKGKVKSGVEGKCGEGKCGGSR